MIMTDFDLNRRVLLGAGVSGLALLAGCGARQAEAPDLAAALDGMATRFLHESPEYATALAVPEARAGGRYIDRLSDVSREGRNRGRTLTEGAIAELRAIDRARLAASDQVSYDVVLTALENSLGVDRFNAGDGAGAPYVVTQLTGAYTGIPDFLDAQHPITSRDQAEAYITRLRAYAGQMDAEIARLNEDAGAGVIPPDFAIDGALAQLNAFARLQPSATVLVQSISRRLPEARDVPEGERAGFVTRAETLVRDEVLPAYRRQIAALTALRPRATHDAGIWRLPQGAEMYAAALRDQTTTNMTPDEVHRMGVDLVSSLQSEMDAILRAQGLTRGTVAERYQQISRRPDQLYPNTDAGRTQLLADLNTQMAQITALMPQAFGTLARAALEIRRVPTYTEAGAPGGYYQSPALDGSRPGAYYINLRDTREWPKFTLPTLTYHEGTPGHHWQISIAQEAQGLPFIRSALLGFNAYQEGWGLYAEQLADELGVYRDNPLGRLGYLQSAAFRASRLVVDTGMHHLRWTREQAIESMVAATGDQRSSVTTEIERYSVWPGQACGYMVGRQAIVRIREAARTALGARFDLRGFHDAVLTNGAMPLSVTESIVNQWVESRRTA